MATKRNVSKCNLLVSSRESSQHVTDRVPYSILIIRDDHVTGVFRLAGANRGQRSGLTDTR